MNNSFLLRNKRIRAAISLMRDRTRRGVVLAAGSVPVNVAMASWKLWLFLAAPSLLLLANVGFNLGVAAVKSFAVVRHHRTTRESAADRTAARQRGFRQIGLAVTVLSVGYALACVPMALGSGTEAKYDPQLAVNIAAVTFAEVGIAIWGAVTARKDREVLIEAVKLTNLASGVVLMVLTQSALLSIDGPANAARYDGYSGLFLGGVAALIGVAMMLRRFPAVTETSDGRTEPAASGVRNMSE